MTEQVAELVKRVRYLLEWMPNCSIGSSGYSRRKRIEEAIAELEYEAKLEEVGE
jgi:hypothetical protein